MASLLFGVMIGLSIGYPLGLFIDALDNRIKSDRR
jgi:capsular polysaccharide biosynthesis protein